MIEYSVNKHGFSNHMFSIRGSVFPKSLVWAIPCAALAAGVWYVQNEILHPTAPLKTRQDAASRALSGFTSVLAFLLIFRTTKAYGRYWECAMYLQKARGEWFNATSNLVSFCSAKQEKAHDVKKFQQQLIRLISLLFCSAMGEISSMDCPEFEIIDPLMDNATLVYVQGKKERSEVVMNWIQRLVVDNIRSNTIEIAPPIVSRVFQEFSLGIVNVAAAKKINFIPFPFPYSQMMQLLLIMQAFVQPIVSGYAYHNWWVAAVSTFFVVLLSWCIHFISVEIEMPFGDDANDLPLGDLVTSMNDSLINLLEDRAQVVPPMHIADTRLHQVDPSDKIPWNPKAPRASVAVEKAISEEHISSSSELRVPVPTTPPAVKPQVFSVAPTLPTSHTSDVSVSDRLAASGSQIEGQLSHMVKQGLMYLPQMQERLDSIAVEVSQLGAIGSRLLDRMDRLDQASLHRPGVGKGSASHIWYCGEAQTPSSEQIFTNTENIKRFQTDWTHRTHIPDTGEIPVSPQGARLPNGPPSDKGNPSILRESFEEMKSGAAVGPQHQSQNGPIWS